MSRARVLLLALAVMAASMLAHAASLRGGFHYDDDHTILLNRTNITDPSSVWRFFRDPGIYSGLPANAMYRPVTYASVVWDALRAEWSGPEPDPVPFHVTNLLVHAAAAAVLFLLLRRILRVVLPGAPPEPAAALGALWFGLHPLHSEVVNYVSARSESLAGLFFLLALWLHHIAWEEGSTGPRRVALVAMAAGASFLSLGSKETGALLFVVAGALELWARPGETPWRTRLARTGRALPLLAVFLLTMALRQEALGAAIGGVTARPAPVGDGEDPFTAGGRTFAAHYLTQARVLIEYGRMLLFPVDLSPDHFVRVSGRLFHPPTLAALVLIGAAVAVVVRSAMRGGRLLPLATVWAAAALAPSVLVPLNVVMNEHRAYLPSTGMALLVGAAWIGLRNATRKPGLAPLATALPTVVLAAFALLDVARAGDWADPARLWGRAVVTDPGSWRAHHHLGVAFFRGAEALDVKAEGPGDATTEEREVHRVQAAELVQGALDRFRAAQAIYPGSFATRLNLGSALVDIARWRNRGSDPDSPPPRTDEYEEAIQWFTKAEEISPGSGRAQYFRATAMAEVGRVDEALAEFTRMRKGDPDRGHLYDFALADLNRRKGVFDAALGWLDRALERDPSSEATVALKKSEILVQAGRFDEADAQLRRAHGLLGPDNPLVLVYMARMLAASGKPQYLPTIRDFWSRAVQGGHRPGPKDRRVLELLTPPR
jgi:tetratricopeptide (TPR) repeat protein